MPKKSFEKYLMSIAVGTGIGMLSSAALIFLMAAFLTIGNIPAAMYSPLTVFILAFGGFFGGFSSAKISQEKGILCGFVSGILFFIFTWIMGILFENFGFGTGALIKVLMIIFSSSFGGILGVNYKRK